MKNSTKKARTPQPAPGITNKTGLDDVLHDLERVNKERHELGLSPISYGHYVAMLEGRAKTGV